MNIAICDDLENDRNVLIDMIDKYCTEHNLIVNITTYINGEELISAFNFEKFDLIFLDIYMSDLNGIETAKEIRKKDNNCIIVFITTSLDFALDAYSLDALQYLLKPINYDKFEEILDTCKGQFLNNMRFIEVFQNGLSIRILLNDIYYIEVYNKACLIHGDVQIIKTYTSLSNLWDVLGGTPFLKCNRSYIINMFYVTDMLTNDFILKNDNKIPIAKHEKTSIKQAYSDYIFQQMRNTM